MTGNLVIVGPARPRALGDGLEAPAAAARVSFTGWASGDAFLNPVVAGKVLRASER